MKKFRKSSNVDEKFFFLGKKFFLFIGQYICEEKFAEKKKRVFWKRKSICHTDTFWFGKLYNSYFDYVRD